MRTMTSTSAFLTKTQSNEIWSSVLYTGGKDAKARRVYAAANFSEA